MSDAFKFLIESTPQVPQSNKLHLFSNYFYSIWFERFKPALWNHYETIGPRSNNHLEGYNFKINKYIDCIHPNIYSLINTFKDLELLISMNFIQITNGLSSKVYRRPIDIKRDEVLFNLKILFFYKSISLEIYLSYIGKLFHYDKTVEFSESDVDIYGFLDIVHPVDLRSIQVDSFEYIKNYIYYNRVQLIELTKLFRNQDLAIYDNQSIDSRYLWLIHLYTTSYVPVKTTGYGDCLFHAVSNNLFGSELNSFKIKLLTVFIQFEYEEFFKLYLNRYGYEYNFETMIKNTAKLGVWGSEINFIAISLLLLRPVHCYEGNNSFSCNPLSINSVPIVLLLQESHFTAGLRCHYFAQVASPRANQLASLKSESPQPIYYN